MSKLSSHTNVYNCCLNILRSKGFILKLYSNDDSVDFDHLTWIALKNGYTLGADNPIELLGLAAIYETIRPPTDQPYWWRIEGEDIFEELMNGAIHGEVASE